MGVADSPMANIGMFILHIDDVSIRKNAAAAAAAAMVDDVVVAISVVRAESRPSSVEEGCRPCH